MYVILSVSSCSLMENCELLINCLNDYTTLKKTRFIVQQICEIQKAEDIKE